MCSAIIGVSCKDPDQNGDDKIIGGNVVVVNENPVRWFLSRLLLDILFPSIPGTKVGSMLMAGL
jgi:hypothetical protein